MYWRRWIRRIIEDMEREMEFMEREMERLLREAKPGRGPYVYGFSLTVGPDGRPVFRTFGNVPRVTGEEGYRTPFVDVIHDREAGEIKVIAEIPGVSKEDIKVRASEDRVEISAERGERRYRASVDLPAEVDVESARATYNNGVLEVTFKTKEKKRPGREIAVE